MRARRADRLRIASCLLAGALATFSPPSVRDASAHLAPPVVRADRVLTIVLFERPTLSYAIRISPVELARVRVAYDRNADGVLSELEAEEALAAWTDGLRALVRYAHIRVPAGSTSRLGSTVPLSSAILLGREATGLAGPTAIPSPSAAATGAYARVAWSFDLRFQKDDRTLTLVDGFSALPFDHSEVVVRDTAERPLVGLGLVTAAHATSGEDAPLSAAPQLSWVDAGQSSTRTIVITWNAPPDRTTPIALAVGCVAVALFVGLSALRARSHRRRG